jgi:hypothetical protein
MDPKNNVFWEEFIEIYRQNSCLWEVKSRVAVSLSSALIEFLIFVVCFEILFLTNSNKGLYVSLYILR